MKEPRENVFARGRENEKVLRERRLSQKERCLEKRFESDQEFWRPIQYDRKQAQRMTEPEKTFLSRPEIELEKLVTVLSSERFDPIRSDLFTEEEMYELLSEVIVSKYKVLLFLGAGFNRAAFLVANEKNERFVVKIPIREYGFSDNRIEIYISSQANEDGNVNIFAQTEMDPGGKFVVQEACRPVSFEAVNPERMKEIFTIAWEFGIGDIQGGLSLKDGLYKVFDFGFES